MSDYAERVTAFGTCWDCKTPFVFDVDTVPAIVIDPATDQPVPFDGTAPPDAVKKPVCPECIDRANVIRRELRLPKIQEGRR